MTSGKDSISRNVDDDLNSETPVSEEKDLLEGSLISSPSGVPTRVNFFPGRRPRSPLQADCSEKKLVISVSG